MAERCLSKSYVVEFISGYWSHYVCQGLFGLFTQLSLSPGLYHPRGRTSEVSGLSNGAVRTASPVVTMREDGYQTALGRRATNTLFAYVIVGIFVLLIVY